MSSIIVLDSSDEDESPPKKANNNKTTSDNGNSSSTVTNASLLKNQQAKQRQIPSGLTITPRLSPTTTKGVSSSGVGNMPTLGPPTSLAAPYQTLNNIINNERLTPTPPKAQAGNVNPRKRKTPTPPQPTPQPTLPRLTTKNFANITNSSPAKAATTLAPLPPIMPMITGVHSMAAAGATPPLQLMATPPHNMAGYMGLNEQLMINPHLLPTSLPPNTTITAHQPQNPNQNNINNNFKIHLPFNKPTTTPSPAASPASSAPKTPSPQLAPSPQPVRTDKSAKRIKPTTLLKSSDESWQKHKQQSQRTPISLSNDVVIEMLPPATESPKSTSASSSRHHTPMTSPTTPKSQKSPDVIMLTPTDHSTVRHTDNDTILDLTQSPDKLKKARCTPPTRTTEIVDLVNTPEQKKHINGIDAAATTKQPKSVSLLKSSENKSEKPPPKPPLEPEYEELIKVCRQADPSNDMEKLIKSKLLKYYYEVHGDFVKSKSFRKSIRNVVDSIKAKPDLVYFNLKTIVEELKVRRKARIVEEASAAAAAAANNNSTGLAANEETPAKDKVKTEDMKATQTTNSSTNNSAAATSSTSSAQSTNANDISATAATSTGNKKLDEQIKKLNKALYVLTKRIEVLEQAEVDWDDDDSSFLQVERYKKRACQIYEKICDLTGESKNAHRLVKKPIKFNETRIPQFNKTLQAFINRTKEFPDYYDVLRMLEHCNRTYSLDLVNFEIKNIAEDAFIKVGKLLQSRRKADLYETVTHYAGDGLDPAKTDPSLAAKLNENLKNHKKISDILEKFARKQDMPEEEEEEEKPDKTTRNSRGDEATPSTLNITTDTEEIITQTTNLNSAVVNEKEVVVKLEENKPDIDKTKNEIVIEEIAEDEYDEEEEDEEEDDEDDEDEVNLDEQVETLANGDVSDNESDTEIMSPKESINSAKEASGHNKTIENVLNEKNNTLDNTVISLNTSSESSITMKNCMDKENNSAIIQINSESNDSIYVNNNNNLDISTTTITKTVINTPITIDKDKSLIPSSSPPSTLLNPLATTPNGKLKDMPLHQLLNSNNSTTTIAESIVYPNVNVTITATTTTTKTTADLKIVHVSSLEPDNDDGDDDDVLLSDSNRNKDVTNLCAELITASSASKSLEEIVISDEES